MKIKIAGLIVATVLSACSSNPKLVEDKNVQESPDVVMSRIDNMSEPPPWLKESEVYKVSDGQIYFLGKQVINADENTEQAFRSAELNAKAGIAKAIEQKFSFVFQNAEEGYNVDAAQARFMGIEASKEIKTGNIRIAKRYWEKYRTTLDNGQRVTKVSVFALVQMPEPEFKAAIIDAARARQGKGGLSADFAKKVDAQWDQFTKSETPNKMPASE